MINTKQYNHSLNDVWFKFNSQTNKERKKEEEGILFFFIPVNIMFCCKCVFGSESEKDLKSVCQTEKRRMMENYENSLSFVWFGFVNDWNQEKTNNDENWEKHDSTRKNKE